MKPPELLNFKQMKTVHQISVDQIQMRIVQCTAKLKRVTYLESKINASIIIDIIRMVKEKSESINNLIFHLQHEIFKQI